MIHKTTELVQKCLEKHNVNTRIFESEDGAMSAVELFVALDKSGRQIYFRFITDHLCKENQNQVLVYAFRFADLVPNERKAVVAEECNRQNNKWAYWKFAVNEQSQIYASSWLPDMTPDDAVGECAFELLRRGISIIEDAIPDFARAIYAPMPKNAGEKAKEIADALRSLNQAPVQIHAEDRPRKEEKQKGEKENG